jgi:8-oxo-dGTP pyrophosphatase MutT (NUDIX family)
MPNGTLIDDYYVLEYSGWVNAIALTQDNEVILIRQYRHGAEDVFLEIPGGCIDPGETPAEAVRRELLEETGYAFDTIEELCALYPNPSTSGNIATSFIAKGGRKVQEQHLDGREEIEVLTVPLAEFKTMVLEHKLLQALHASAALYALIHLDKIS